MDYHLWKKNLFYDRNTNLLPEFRFINYICSISITALSGNYVNFGVFELYGDRALADAFDVALKMILSIPLADVLAYPKVSLVCLQYWLSND